MARHADEIAVLRRFVALQLAPTAEAPLALDPQAAVALALFLDHAPDHDLIHFCRYDLPRLLQHLSRRTQGERRVLHGRVRGRIEWLATIKARHSGEYDPTRFVCREVRHQFDTPENQLLVAFLDMLETAHATIPAWLRDGTTVMGAEPADDRAGNEGEGDAAGTQARLAMLRVSTQRARRNIYLRQVTPPVVVTDEHHRRAHQADVPEYARLATLYAHVAAHLHHPADPGAQAYAAQVFRHTLPLPAALTPRADHWLRALVAVVGEQGSAQSS